MHTQRSLLMAVSMLAGLGALFPAALAEDAALKGTGEVIVTSGGGSWEDAQRIAFFEPFEKETGIKVALVAEDHAKLLASVDAGVTEADLTSINAGQLTGFKKRNAIVPTNYSFFTPETLAGIPKVLKNEYGVGANYYSIGVAYNTDRFPDDKGPKNWRDYFDIEKYPGPRGMANCDKIIDGGMLEGALLGDGVEPDKLYPLDMDRAFKKIEAFKPQVKKWWAAGAEAPQGLINGELDVSSAYNGRIFAARKQGAPLKFEWDQSLLQYDYWVTMRGSPNPENAAKFLAFISKPEQQAAFVKAIGYGPINDDTYKLLDPAMSPDLPGSPENIKRQILQDYDWWTSAGSDGRTNWDVGVEKCVKLLSN